MSLFQNLISAWRNFFFTPCSPLPICVFRILFGLLCLAFAFLIAPDILIWYGPYGVISLDLMNQILGSSCLDLFAFIPQTDRAASSLFYLFVFSAVLVTLGVFTRPSQILLYFLLSSLHFRNPTIINGGDDLLRVYSFFLIFAPTGECLSVDNLIRKQKNPQHTVPLKSPWPLRLIQIEITLLYLEYTVTKLFDMHWLNGTAVYYVLLSPELQRFPLFFDRHNLLIAQALTWGTLVIEFSLFTLIWVRKYRYYVLIFGFLFHMCLDYCLNIPLFQFVIVSSYVLFIDPSDLQLILNKIKAPFLPKAKLSP